jgi:glycosyltransferase involved in cell wall biosynthesis
VPDVIVGHPGWGEPLFAKQVWPGTRLGLYAEFFYQIQGADVGFDPEFAPPDPEVDACRLQMKKLNHLAHLDQADGALSPTHWQASTFPPAWRERICVAHDGIDTDVLCPVPDGRFLLPGGSGELTRDDEVITYVALNLEPYRGFHVFMRALPDLLCERPKAQVLLVDGEETGYGAAAPAGRTWREVFCSEVQAQMSEADWARVHVLGRLEREAFTRLLQVSRVHVYLSDPFMLSWSLLEAMSVGAAIVASDTAPVREVITPGETGQLVDFFDRAGLVRSIGALLDDAGERQRLGAAARAFAQSRYDLGRVCLPQQLAWVQSLSAGL